MQVRVSILTRLYCLLLLSANYGFKENGLNQIRGSRIIEEFEPGISGGFAFGFAYSFNYDVSMTMSYQQSFNTRF